MVQVSRPNPPLSTRPRILPPSWMGVSPHRVGPITYSRWRVFMGERARPCGRVGGGGTLLNPEVVSVALGWLAAAASLLVLAMLDGTHPADDEGHPRWVFSQTLRNVPRE